MSRQTVLEIAAPHCVAQDFGGEIIALNLTSGTYCSLRELGAIVWRDLAAGHPAEILAALAAGRLGGTQPVLDFAANAMAQGLMRPAAGDVTPRGEPELAGVLASGQAGSLVFEVHEDMKTLILLDPVHEVDESRGWPNLPPNA